MREQELFIYRCTGESARLLADMVWLMENWEGAEAGTPDGGKALFCSCLHRLFELAGAYGFCGNLWHCYLTDLLVNSENSYSTCCERCGEIPGSVNEAVLHDMALFREFYQYDFGPMARGLGVPSFALAERYEGSRDSKVYSRRICKGILELAKEMGKAGTAGEMKDLLTAFYREYGVGTFGLHKAFRIAHREGEMCIEPIRNIAHVGFDDLVGYELQKRKLKENTEAFLAGRRANNCLLFGDAGTGKSTCIKAIANEYYGQGLRIIEVYRHQFQDLNQVIARVKDRNYRFILYMDDLSFEESETEYKYLKAVIEGGLEKRPENVLIYATSNRRHLIRENYGDREEIRQDMHTGDTVQEKLSLARRFGVTIYFGAPDKRQFEAIVAALADRAGLGLPREELLAQALQWELANGGLSGRSAQQFVDHLSGRQQEQGI